MHSHGVDTTFTFKVKDHGMALIEIKSIQVNMK